MCDHRVRLLYGVTVRYVTQGTLHVMGLKAGRIVHGPFIIIEGIVQIAGSNLANSFQLSSSATLSVANHHRA